MSKDVPLDAWMAQLANLFAGRTPTNDDLYNPLWLDRAKLDFSLESLDEVGRYLSDTFSDGFDGSPEQDKAIL